MKIKYPKSVCCRLSAVDSIFPNIKGIASTTGSQRHDFGLIFKGRSKLLYKYITLNPI